jgi:hypothetical protein
LPLSSGLTSKEALLAALVAPEEWPDGFNDMPEEARGLLIRKHVRLLHVYGQYSQHDEVEIVGNRNALVALQIVIDHALKFGVAETTQMTSDGEGYGVVVKLDDKPWDSPAWETKHLPYSNPVSRGMPDPRTRIDQLEYALRKANALLVKRGAKPVTVPDEEA